MLEAPGYDEVTHDDVEPVEVERRRRAFPYLDERFLRRGKPVVGKAGAILFGWGLGALEIRRDACFIDNGLRCFSGDCIVRASGIKRIYRRWYVGPVLEVETSKKKFTGTPNHPVFTTRGLIPLKELQQTDELLQDSGDIGVFDPSNPHLNHGPIRFDELFSALSNMGISERTVGSPNDFHGDGSNSNVYVVRPNSFLFDGTITHHLQAQRNFFLEHADKTPGFFERLRTAHCHALRQLRLHLSSTQGSVSLSGDLFPPFWTDADAPEYLCFSVSSNDHATGFEDFRPRSPTDSKLMGEGLQPFPRNITSTKINSIKWRDFSSHVYNLETTKGYYTTGNTFVSNCLPPKGKQGPYPTGATRLQAEACCRQWDRWTDRPGDSGVLPGYNPTHSLISIHPAAVVRDTTPTPLMVRTIEKASQLVERGARPLILFGGKATKLWLGYGENVTRWSGHWQRETERTGQLRMERLRVMAQAKGKSKKLTAKEAIRLLLEYYSRTQAEGLYPKFSDEVLVQFDTLIAPKEKTK